MRLPTSVVTAGAIAGTITLFSIISKIRQVSRINKIKNSNKKKGKRLTELSSYASYDDIKVIFKLLRDAKYIKYKKGTKEALIKMASLIKNTIKEIESIDNSVFSIKSEEEWHSKKEMIEKKYYVIESKLKSELDKIFKELDTDEWVDDTDKSIAPFLQKYASEVFDTSNFRIYDADDFWECVDFLSHDNENLKESEEKWNKLSMEVYEVLLSSPEYVTDYDKRFFEIFKMIKIQLSGELTESIIMEELNMNRNELVASIMLEAADLLRMDSKGSLQKLPFYEHFYDNNHSKEWNNEKSKLASLYTKAQRICEKNVGPDYKYTDVFDKCQEDIDKVKDRIEEIEKKEKNINNKAKALKESIDALYEAAYTADSLNEANTYIEKAELLEAVLTEGLVDKLIDPLKIKMNGMKLKKCYIITDNAVDKSRISNSCFKSIKDAILFELNYYGSANKGKFHTNLTEDKNPECYIYEITAYVKESESTSLRYKVNKQYIKDMKLIGKHTILGLAKKNGYEILNLRELSNKRKKVLAVFKSMIKDSDISKYISNPSKEDESDFIDGSESIVYFDANLMNLYNSGKEDEAIELANKVTDLAKKINSQIDKDYKVEDDWHKYEGIITLSEV